VTCEVLILRPEPGAARTGERARQLGLSPTVAPLFRTMPLAWDAPPPLAFDAIFLTSLHAARLAGRGLAAYLRLPCYAVGDATAEAAAEAGFLDVRTGPSDGAALVRQAAADGITRALHLCGRDHIDLDEGPVSVTSRPVYAAEADAQLPSLALGALERGALLLLHSPRAARTAAHLIDEAGIPRERIRLAAISAAAADAAGPGWQARHAAEAPRDEALLALAARLCGVKLP